MSKHKTQILLALGAGLIISDIVPTIADYYVFKKDQELKEKLEKGEITPKQYWERFAFAYYAYNPMYWALLVGASMYFGKDYAQKRNILISLIAGGAVIGVLFKNIQKDEKFYSTHKIVEKQSSGINGVRGLGEHLKELKSSKK
jgi:uncharacterized membrane protein YkvI